MYSRYSSLHPIAENVFSIKIPDTGDSGKRVVFWISVRISFWISGSDFVPGCDRIGTNPLFEFLYQDGHVLVQKQNPKSKKKS